ncbi:InlB B-repeat-containing protein [Sporosarcina limicola]|uniref:Repeat protein (TIGR02543 family) n=1 Tax=Sporosarcina limicola TaxID=34101 RepID=A0A927MKW8_9BACL|nr:InlB B-repeat-containing protein [Sporosarcina limicola]MBE1556478.1 putative repeat protein (TIGR02543 family) [Sporosarcina limicola]
MRKSSLLLVIFFLLMSQFSGFSVYALSENGFEYDVNSDGISVTITGYTDTATDVVIPNMLDGKTVTGIGDDAFKSKGLTSVTMQEDLMTIGRLAFRDNKLTSVVIPNSVTAIGEYAFASNLLETVDIPDNVTTIQSFSFNGNNLSSVVFPSNVTLIKQAAFSGNKLTSIVLPNSVIEIGQTAFGSNLLTSVTIPDSVTTIEHFAFENNQLSSVIIPSSVTRIGEKVFDRNTLNNVKFEGTPTTNPSSFTGQTKPSAVFIEWFNEPEFSTNWNNTVPQPMTIYAKYSYMISFNTTGGTVVLDQRIPSNEKALEPVAPTKVGHTFAGWYKEAALTTEWIFTTDTVTAATTLHAKWDTNSYTLSFEENGGTAVANQTIMQNEKATAPTPPTKSGHTFAGWYKEAALTNEWIFTTDTVTAATMLHAKWNTNSYTLSFEENGGTAVANQTIVHNEKAITPTVPTKAGHTFAGWYKETALTNEWKFASDVLTENTALYAKWTTNHSPSGGGGYISTNTLTFNTNGGSTVAAQTLAYNEKAANPIVPTKANHKFAGWYKEAALTNEWRFATDVVTENSTLYAKWTMNHSADEEPAPIPVQTPEEVERPEESTGPMCTIRFTDTSTHWAKEMIEDIASRCIIIGYPDGTFRPNEPIKRRHVAIMFTRAFELAPIRNSIAFSDVPTNHFYYAAITKVYQAGIFDGASNGKFNPDANMTRAQMAKVLVLAFGLESNGTSANLFRDVPSTHWAKDYISTLADNRIALGDNGDFKPDEPVTRAQFVSFIYRALNL